MPFLKRKRRRDPAPLPALLSELHAELAILNQVLETPALVASLRDAGCVELDAVRNGLLPIIEDLSAKLEELQASGALEGYLTGKTARGVARDITEGLAWHRSVTAELRACAEDRGLTWPGS